MTPKKATTPIALLYAHIYARIWSNGRRFRRRSPAAPTTETIAVRSLSQKPTCCTIFENRQRADRKSPSNSAAPAHKLSQTCLRIRPPPVREDPKAFGRNTDDNTSCRNASQDRRVPC